MILKDAESVLQFLCYDLLIPKKNIVVMGRSIGSGPAIDLASKHDIGNLVVISPFISIKEATSDLLGIVGSLARYLVKDRFQNIDKIGKVKCPILFIHGQNDSVVPFSHSQKLYGTLY